MDSEPLLVESVDKRLIQDTADCLDLALKESWLVRNGRQNPVSVFGILPVLDPQLCPRVRFARPVEVGLVRHKPFKSRLGDTR